jgi:hypothetical protein
MSLSGVATTGSYTNQILLPAGSASGAITTIITSSQSGSTVLIPQQTNNNNIVSLPPPQAGFYLKFVVLATANGANTLTITPVTAGKIRGQTIGVAAGLVPVAFTGKNSVILGATAVNVIPGDWAICESDGINYYWTCFSSGTASGWTAP